MYLKILNYTTKKEVMVNQNPSGKNYPYAFHVLFCVGRDAVGPPRGLKIGVVSLERGWQLVAPHRHPITPLPPPLSIFVVQI